MNIYKGDFIKVRYNSELMTLIYVKQYRNYIICLQNDLSTIYIDVNYSLSFYQVTEEDKYIFSKVSGINQFTDSMVDKIDEINRIDTDNNFFNNDMISKIINNFSLEELKAIPDYKSRDFAITSFLKIKGYHQWESSWGKKVNNPIIKNTYFIKDDLELFRFWDYVIEYNIPTDRIESLSYIFLYFDVKHIPVDILDTISCKLLKLNFYNSKEHTLKYKRFYEYILPNLYDKYNNSDVDVFREDNQNDYVYGVYNSVMLTNFNDDFFEDGSFNLFRDLSISEINEVIKMTERLLDVEAFRKKYPKGFDGSINDLFQDYDMYVKNIYTEVRITEKLIFN